MRVWGFFFFVCAFFLCVLHLNMTLFFFLNVFAKLHVVRREDALDIASIFAQVYVCVFVCARVRLSEGNYV